MTTSAVGNDFRTWNAAFAKQCNAPWYPSPDNFPTMDDYRPNCTWIGTDDRFPHSISIKLSDFSFPGTDNPRATAIAEEIKNNQDYLCNAPGRMMFWKNGDEDACVPSYPPIKRYDNGTAIDPTQILQGHSFNRACDLKKIGTPWFNYPALIPSIPKALLGAGPVVDDSNTEPPPPKKILPKRAVPLAKPALPAIDPAIARRWGGERPKTEIERRRVLQARRDHCVENLVISEHADHSARSVCESETSFGPDFVSLYDGSYCDMCERKLYPLCRPSARDGCFDLSKRELRLGPQELSGRDLQDMSPPKTYKHVARWSSKRGST
ncbi:hypothetical protein GQ53DRAFT_834058 [Thozetella sp. PMI_491]|nr:hypothetical protein GQ53DRAFT_834058 [Thozetella sp. PMI_491]